jgi:hypothetical protein
MRANRPPRVAWQPIAASGRAAARAWRVPHREARAHIGGAVQHSVRARSTRARSGAKRRDTAREALFQPVIAHAGAHIAFNDAKLAAMASRASKHDFRPTTPHENGVEGSTRTTASPVEHDSGRRFRLCSTGARRSERTRR